MSFFSQTLPLSFFLLASLILFSLSNPPSRLCMPCFLSNLLRKWVHVSVNWKYSTLSYILFHSSVASLSSHVPFSCAFPRIPHLLFQSLFMLPPNSKKSFVFLVLYVQLICFVFRLYLWHCVRGFLFPTFPCSEAILFTCWTDTPVTFVTHIWKASKCQISSVSNIKNIKRNFIEIRQDCFVSLVKQSWILFWVFLSEFEIFNDPIEIQNDPPWMNWNSQRILFILRVLDIVKSLYSTNPTQDSWKKIPGIFPLNPFWCSTEVFYAFGCISHICARNI